MTSPLQIIWSRYSDKNDASHIADLHDRIRKVLKMGLCDPYSIHCALEERSEPEEKITMHPESIIPFRSA